MTTRSQKFERPLSLSSLVTEGGLADDSPYVALFLPGGHGAIVQVEATAFGHDKEAQLTEALLADPTARPTLSLLAFHEQRAVGHVLFTRVTLDAPGSEQQPLLHILAPLAVVPSHQKQGIGRQLIQTGLEHLRQSGSEMVFVLGHIGYYDRFGFLPDAASHGYPAPFPNPAEFAAAWMVQPLQPSGLTTQKGRVVCADALNHEEHWRE